MAKYQVCPVCDGEGKIVHPAISVVTQEQFDNDPDFFEEYMSGHYDIRCPLCKGLRVVTQEQLDEYYK